MDGQFNLEKPVSIGIEGHFEANLLVQTIIRLLVIKPLESAVGISWHCGDVPDYSTFSTVISIS